MIFKNKKIKKFIICSFFSLTILSISQNVYAHEHTADCYGGTLHTCQGDLTNGGSCYSQVAQNCLGTMTYTETSKSSIVCASCNNEIQDVKVYDVKCSACAFGSKSIEQPVTCPSCNTALGIPEGYIKFGSNCPKTYNVYQKTCNKTSGKYYNSQGQYLNPSCNSVIISITPKIQNQVTDKPDFTIIATYLDGHTAEKQPTKVDYTVGKKYNNTTIEVSYSGIVTRAGNKGTLKTSITLSSPTPIETPTPTTTTTPTPTQNVTKTPTTTPMVTPTIETSPTIIPTEQPTITPIQSTTVEQPTNNQEVIVESNSGFAYMPEITEEPNKIVIDNNNKNKNDITKLDSVYYDSDENEGVEEERDYLKVEKEEKKISLVGILLIVFSVLFGVILAIYTIVTITKHIVNKNKKVTQINLNDYMRR